MKQLPQPAAFRAPGAAAYVGIGLSTLWHRVKNDPSFPKGRKLGPRTTVFLRHELDAYLERFAKEAA